MRILIIIVVLLISIISRGQVLDSNNSARYDSVNFEFSGLIYLDSVVVVASRSGFDVQDFIEMVQKDNSFYKAFKNLRFAEYDFDNHLRFYNKKGKIISELKNNTHQYYRNKCRWMKNTREEKNYNVGILGDLQGAKLRPQGAGFGRKSFRVVGTQGAGNQIRNLHDPIRCYAPSYQFRRSNPQPIHIASDTFNRQPNPTGQKSGLAQLL